MLPTLRVLDLAQRAAHLALGDVLQLEAPAPAGMHWSERLAAVIQETAQGWAIGQHSASASSPRDATPSHGWPTDELLARDACLAGLRLLGREGGRVRLRRERTGLRDPSPLSVARLAALLQHITTADRLLHRHRSPARVLEEARRVGRSARPGATRLDLRAWISLLEPLRWGQRGCYRRVVTEVLSVPEAADEAVAFGLTPRATGHAWFVDSMPWAPRHPVQFTL